MTDAVRAEPMPIAVRAARFMMTLQVAFGLVGLVIGVAGIVVTGFAWRLVLLVACYSAIMSLTCWLMSRWPGRRRVVRWAVIVLETVSIAGILVADAIDPGLAWDRVLVQGALPSAVVVLLLLPQSGPWFKR